MFSESFNYIDWILTPVLGRVCKKHTDNKISFEILDYYNAFNDFVKSIDVLK